MNIVFASYGDFDTNSALHIVNIANRLQLRGHHCVVAVPGDPNGCLQSIGAPMFRTVSMRHTLQEVVERSLGRVDLVVAWTPREVVRRFVEALCRKTKSPYVVHLEDNEDVIAAVERGLPIGHVLEKPRWRRQRQNEAHLSHPDRMRHFLAGAAGVTALGDALLEFAPPHVPTHVFWPGWNEDSFAEQPTPDAPTREKLGIPDDACVIVYQGNAHKANATDMRSLYSAVAIANRAGMPARLIRIGRDHVDFLGDLAGIVGRYVTTVGYLPDHRSIASYLALADVCVQPGKANAFNDYRFPSKIPEFMIAGKPLVMAKTNVGRVLEHKKTAWIMERGESIEIARAICELSADPALRRRLVENARAWALERLSWSVALEGLEPFYESCRGGISSVGTQTGRYGRTQDQEALFMHDDVKHWISDEKSVSYATVRDWVESLDRYPDLATRNKDLKDVQRPWVLKTILESVPRGSRLLEIGGGDPWVADLLSKQGYDVSIVDPYDGRDNGPSNIADFRRSYPRIRFIQGLFPDAIESRSADLFDAIYSISVLEHIPATAIVGVGGGIKRLLKPGGFSVHAIDHVLLGNGADQHLSNLRQWCRCLCGDDRRLDGVVAALEKDPEAYFLSAEAHNMWRGKIPYDDFPMRRCVSIHFTGVKSRI